MCTYTEADSLRQVENVRRHSFKKKERELATLQMILVQNQNCRILNRCHI